MSGINIENGGGIGKPVTQLLVLGRGVELASDKLPGTVRYDSPHSGDSYDRAFAATLYANMHSEVEKIVFSGFHSFVLPEHEVPASGSEAEGMADVSRALRISMSGSETRVLVVRKEALTTYGNYTESKDDFDLDQEIGLVAHKDHMKRALKIGSFVIPEATFVPIYADNPIRGQSNRGFLTSDRIAALIYGIRMLDIKAGDIEAIKKRDEGIQKFVLSGLALKASVFSHLPNKQAA